MDKLKTAQNIGTVQITKTDRAYFRNKYNTSVEEIADELEICASCTPELSQDVVNFLRLKVLQIRSLKL